MASREPKLRPQPWAVQRAAAPSTGSLQVLAIKFAVDWVIYHLWRWGLLRILEYSGFISVMFAVGTYFNEAPDRKKQKHYQAWQVINTAQGKGGSGGRVEAMQELNADKIPLVGVDVSGAFLQGLRLPKANLVRSDFQGSDLRDCAMQSAHLEYSNLKFANLRSCDLHGAHLKDADLESADFFGCNLSGTDLSATNLKEADLRYAELKGMDWQAIVSMEGANVYGVKNPPDGFIQWALQHGAVSKAEE